MIRFFTGILAFGVAVSAYAHPNFSGIWKGPGLMSGAAGNYACLASLQIQEADAELHFDSRKFVCDGVDYDWQGLKFTVRGDQLFMGALAVGAFTADGLNAEWTSEDKLIVWQLGLQAKNGKLTYQYTRSYDGQLTLQQATLEKKQ